MKITEEILETLKTQKGGYTRETLAILGVPWPPKRGWKKALLKDVRAYNRQKAKSVGKPRRKNKSPSVYKMVEWKRVRYDALKASDGRCELCGVSKHDGAKLNVDHIKPLSTHWHLRFELSNLQVLCGSCNCGKGGDDDTDWREPSLRVLMGEEMA